MPLVTRSVNHCPNAILAADVARVDAQAVDAELGYPQSDLVIEMDIGDQRQLYALLDPAEGLRSLHRRHRDPDDVSAGIGQALICPTVASTSQVSVLVMLCTEIGASPRPQRRLPRSCGLATFDRRFGMHGELTVRA